MPAAQKAPPKPPKPPSPRRKPLKKGDHVFLVDGSGYIFRAYHALPPITRKSDGLQLNAVFGFCNMLWKLLRDMKADEKPTHLAVVFDLSEQTFRTEMYPDYKAHRPDPPDDLRPQFPLIREAVHAFDLPCLEQERLRGRRPDRDLCAAGLRGRRHLDHRLVGQGFDAARQRLRRHVRHHEGQEDRPRRGDREIRRAAGQGHRGAGADRRFHRQRAGRARHRRQRPRRSSSANTAISKRCSSAPARSSRTSAGKR